VTGLTVEFLADKPRFSDVVDEFLTFVDGAEVIIHNAAFDVGFLDSELTRIGAHYGRMHERVRVECSLAMARQRYPGQRNSLDALCRRLGVDNSHRQLHGALLDAQLLAEAYLAMTAGQGEIGFASVTQDVAMVVVTSASIASDAAARPRVHVSEDDTFAHNARVAAIRAKSGKCVWDLSLA